MIVVADAVVCSGSMLLCVLEGERWIEMKVQVLCVGFYVWGVYVGGSRGICFEMNGL